MSEPQLNAFARWRMCDRKRAFPTQAKANAFARKRDMSAYQCPCCSQWHVTSRPKEPS
jgi:hypothetical protein